MVQLSIITTSRSTKWLYGSYQHCKFCSRFSHQDFFFIITEFYYAYFKRENVFLYLDLTPEEEAVVLSDETGVRMHPYVGSIRPMKKKLMLSR